MTAKDKAFEAWMLSDLEAVASVIRARGEQNAEIVRTALRKAWDAGREAEREVSEEYNKAYLDECAEMAKEAVESEREACAKLCESMYEVDPGVDEVADAIRARGSQ